MLANSKLEGSRQMTLFIAVYKDGKKRPTPTQVEASINRFIAKVKTDPRYPAIDTFYGVHHNYKRDGSYSGMTHVCLNSEKLYNLFFGSTLEGDTLWTDEMEKAYEKTFQTEGQEVISAEFDHIEYQTVMEAGRPVVREVRVKKPFSVKLADLWDYEDDLSQEIEDRFDADDAFTARRFHPAPVAICDDGNEITMKAGSMGPDPRATKDKDLHRLILRSPGPGVTADDITRLAKRYARDDFKVDQRGSNFFLTFKLNSADSHRVYFMYNFQKVTIRGKEYTIKFSYCYPNKNQAPSRSNSRNRSGRPGSRNSSRSSSRNRSGSRNRSRYRNTIPRRQHFRTPSRPTTPKGSALPHKP